jgi:hypothetical protein
MVFSVEVNDDDYREAALALAQRRRDHLRPLRWWGLGSTAIGFLLLAGGIRHADTIGPILMMVTGMFVVIYPIWTAYSRVENAFKHYERLMTGSDVEADERGITFTNPRMRGTWYWEGLRHFRETSRLLILFVAKDQPLAIIPKRCVGTDEELQTFRALLSRRIEGFSSGFPVITRPQKDSPAESPK